VYLLCFVLFVLGPAHILCLSVAKVWNKERFISEVLPLLRHRTSCSALGPYYYNSRIRYLIWHKVFAISVRLHVIIWIWANLTFAAIRDVFKTSDQIRVSNRGIYSHKTYINVCIVTITVGDHMMDLVADRRFIFTMSCAHYSFCSSRGIGCHTRLTIRRITLRASDN